MTRHLARFLCAAPRDQASRHRYRGDDDQPAGAGLLRPRCGAVRPNAILFNGGFFTPPVARERIVQAMTAWSGTPPRVFRWSARRPPSRSAPRTTATCGAARRDAPRADPRRQSAQLLPGRAGTRRRARPGSPPSPCCRAACRKAPTVDLAARVFTVLTNRAVSFPLYSSLVRTDRARRRGRRSTRSATTCTATRRSSACCGTASGRVRRKSRCTCRPASPSSGTLELWLQSAETAHRWRLQFQLRGAATDDDPSACGPIRARRGAGCRRGHRREPRQLLDDVFAGASRVAATPETVVARNRDARRIRQAGLARRRCCGGSPTACCDSPDARRRGHRFEARWLNLAGFCLRPGFGASADEWRIGGDPEGLRGRPRLPERRPVPGGVADPVAARVGRVQRRAAARAGACA